MRLVAAAIDNGGKACCYSVAESVANYYRCRLHYKPFAEIKHTS